MPSDAFETALQLYEGGNLPAAEATLKQLLAADPVRAAAWHLMGLVCHRTNRPDAAIESLERAIQINGNEATFLSNLGAVYREVGKLDKAVACCQRAVQLNSGSAAAYYNLGSALHDQGNLVSAADCFRRALELKPDYFVAYNNLGAVHLAMGKLEEAIACFRRTLAALPDDEIAHYNLGAALQGQGKLGEAARCYEQAIKLNDDFSAAHYQLGTIYQERGDFTAAQLSFEKSLELNPCLAEAELGLGIVLQKQGRLDEAVAAFSRAVQIKRDEPHWYNLLGNALCDSGRGDEALCAFDEAVRLKPDYAEARANRSLLLLQRGEFITGWEEYQWRWKSKELSARVERSARWDGRNLGGGTIVLRAEQGIGDTLQFVRYAPLVKQRAGHVVLQCEGRLAPLLGRCRGIDEVVASAEMLGHAEADAYLTDLPFLFRTTLNNIPREIPYLSADQALVEQWRNRLPIGQCRVGIAWQGNPDFKYDKARSIPLAQFSPLLLVEGIQFLSLQKGPGTQQLAQFPWRDAIWQMPQDADESAGAFMDTAAVMKSLDLMITSDSAIAHLAGALGVSVWMALPLAPDWRWLLERSDSPWYPTMRLFRQQRAGDWEGVFAELKIALQKWVNDVSQRDD